MKKPKLPPYDDAPRLPKRSPIRALFSPSNFSLGWKTRLVN